MCTQFITLKNWWSSESFKSNQSWLMRTGIGSCQNTKRETLKERRWLSWKRRSTLHSLLNSYSDKRITKWCRVSTSWRKNRKVRNNGKKRLRLKTKGLRKELRDMALCLKCLKKINLRSPKIRERRKLKKKVHLIQSQISTIWKINSWRSPRSELDDLLLN